MNTMWGNTDDAANSVNWAARSIQAGSGKAAQAANNTALYQNVTPGAFNANHAVGQFGVAVEEMANTNGESQRVTHAGWQLRRAGEGPLTGMTASNGAGFANGETVVFSNGTANGSGIVVTNATSNLASITISSGGLFTNADIVAYDFNREQHLVSVFVDAGTGYSNTDYIVVSNGSVNATATIDAVDGNGMFSNTDITITAVGLFANDLADNEVVITVFAANGAASNGTGATLTANIAASSGGVLNAFTLGGRAGRVTYECLIAMGSLANTGTGDDTYLPE